MLLPIFCLLFLNACSTTPSHLEFSIKKQDLDRVWPALPEVPRYRYVGELTGEANFTSTNENSNAFTTALRWIAGLGQEYLNPKVLQRPQAIMVDDSGRILVTDVSRQAIFNFDVARGELTIWEWARPGVRFVAPIGIVAGKNNEVLVADAELGRVIRLDKNGIYLGEMGENILRRPTGLARDPVQGLIYVADTRAHDIKVFNDQGLLVDTLGRRGDGPGEFNAPTHLSFVGNKLYVSDTLNSRVQVFDASGMLLKLFGDRGLYVGNLNRPKGVTADDEGNIYIIESYRDHLLIFNANGDYLLPIGGTGSGIGEFYLPSGIYIDPRNRIYIADMFNGRIEVFQYLGERE
ncbi:NHL repeat domain protein [hydrothermal vent metagenome]|uniref:NHL repeat domain protein n=1 Tax=hydrothermal vent metagenome TaxID=652676 RepID=A0A3B1ARE3_9ZZZZ